MKYTAKLEMTCEELKNCSKCKGLGNCKNKVKGCVYYPNVDGNIVMFDYVACKYRKEQIEQDKLKPLAFNEPQVILDAKMADIDLGDKKRSHVLKWVTKFYKDYQKNKNIKGCYLHGSFGSGKSYILAALINELAKNGAKCVIMYYPEMLVNLKESFYDDFDEKLRTIKTCDVLMIDDIGAESVTQWSRDEILGTILQYRMDAKLPTFFTSNLNIEELTTHLSQTKTGVDIVKAKRIIERIKFLSEDLELISENRRK
jgi:primosomal protein DnaI